MRPISGRIPIMKSQQIWSRQWQENAKCTKDYTKLIIFFTLLQYFFKVNPVFWVRTTFPRYRFDLLINLSLRYKYNLDRETIRPFVLSKRVFVYDGMCKKVYSLYKKIPSRKLLKKDLWQIKLSNRCIAKPLATLIHIAIWFKTNVKKSKSAFIK